MYFRLIYFCISEIFLKKLCCRFRGFLTFYICLLTVFVIPNRSQLFNTSFEYKIRLWIHKGYFVVKELVWNFQNKDFWYTKSYLLFKIIFLVFQIHGFFPFGFFPFLGAFWIYTDKSIIYLNHTEKMKIYKCVVFCFKAWSVNNYFSGLNYW